MRLVLLILIGLPGSGKTTFAKNLAKNFKQFNGKFIHVCYDDLIPFPNGNFNNFEWKSARNSVSVKILNLIKAIKYKNTEFCPPEFENAFKSIKYCEGDIILVIDDNMYFKSMRYSLFLIAKKHNISFCQIYLNCSLENALFNNSRRQTEFTVPSDVIINMSKKIEPPNRSNNWEKYSLEFSDFNNIHEIHSELFTLLNDSLNNPFYEKDDDESKELSKIQCKKSVLHQSDIALRRIISCLIKNYFSENPKEKSKDFVNGLNLRKAELLSDIKAGNICLTDEVLDEINSDVLEKFQLIKFLESYF